MQHTLAGGGGETLASVLVRKEGFLVVVLRRAPKGRSLAGRRDEHDRNILTGQAACVVSCHRGRLMSSNEKSQGTEATPRLIDKPHRPIARPLIADFILQRSTVAIHCRLPLQLPPLDELIASSC